MVLKDHYFILSIVLFLLKSILIKLKKYKQTKVYLYFSKIKNL